MRCATTAAGRRPWGGPTSTWSRFPIERITPDGVRTVDGDEHPADVLIYGTGFTASDFVAPMRVFGVGGVELNEEWGGDAQRLPGRSRCPGFPNFFMLYGPNTNLVINGSILIMVECQVRYAVEAIGRLLRSGHRTMSCRRDVHERYGREMEEGNAMMVWGVADVPDLVPQRARARHAELALRPAHLLVAHARARPGRLRAGLTPFTAQHGQIEHAPEREALLFVIRRSPAM